MKRKLEAMNIKIYNKILNTERSRTLTERFAASKRISDQSDRFKDLPELVDAYDEASLEMYRRAMATQPRNADEALLLFQKLMEDIRPDIESVLEALPFIQKAIDNLNEWLKDTAELHDKARRLLLGEKEE